MRLFLIAVGIFVIASSETLCDIMLVAVFYFSLDGLELIPFKKYLYNPVRGMRPGEKVYTDHRDLKQ